MRNLKQLMIASKDRMLKVAITAMGLLWLGLIAATWAADDADAAETEPAGSAPSPDDEYNFNWLDPEKKIYVLQNRRYLKANRLELSLMGGLGFSNPYRTTYNLDPRITYNITEAWAVEVFFTVTSNSENNVYKALGSASPNALPTVREINSQYGGLVKWSPWYAKINVFNKILYFDWYLTGGMGGLNTAVDNRATFASGPRMVSESLFSLFAGTGQQFHLNHHFVFKLDVTAAYYNASYIKNSTDTAWFSNYNFGMGVGFKL